MSRIAEIAVQTPVSSSSKPGRAETADPGGFSALVDAEAATEPSADAVPVAKPVEASEPTSSAQKALPSLEQMMMALLPGAPDTKAADASAAGVLQTTSQDDIVAQALAALAVAADGGVAADETPDTQIADVDADAATTDAQIMASSASATVVAAAIVAPVVVSNIVVPDIHPQIDLASPDNVTQIDISQPPAVGTDVKLADARLAAEADAATQLASAEAASRDGAPLVPGEVKKAEAAVALSTRQAGAVRREAADVPPAGVSTADVAVDATVRDAKSVATLPVGDAAAKPDHAEPKQMATSDDGVPKDTARTDATSAAASDPKPAIAVNAPAASAQAQSVQMDSPAVGPAVAHTQPSLLQAQLIATPAAPDVPVPVEGLAVEIVARATSGKSRFEIRLDPPELGRIDVRLDIDRHGRVGTHLLVEKAETLDLLRRDAPQLERALAESGLKTSDSGLQFSLRDQSFAGRNDQNENRQHNARLMISEDDTVPAAVAGRSYRTTGAAGGLDIRV